VTAVPNPQRPALDGNRSNVVVYIAGSWFDGPPGHDRRMAEALGEFAPVLFVDPPISFLTRVNQPQLGQLMEQPRLRVFGPRLARLVTAVPPGQSRPGLRHATPPAIRWAVRRAVARLYPGGKGDPVAAVLCSQVANLLRVVPAARTVYYATDDLAAGSRMLGISRQRLLGEEARMLREAGAVAAVSPVLQQRYAEDGYEATLVPNGCAPETYAGVDRIPPHPDVRLPGPVAGFVGHINDRIDLGLLEAVAETGCSLLIVGPVARGYQQERFAALTTRSNVQWVGRQPYEQIPSFLRAIDVGLTPYAGSEFNQASFPLKTLEYLAAGRDVVATPLPAHTWLGTDLITIAEGPQQYAAAVTRALGVHRTEALAQRRRDFAWQHSWRQRATQLATLLGIQNATVDGHGRSDPTPARA
jgi:teichuronic acid biosynthesis glycosyltransferase TuaH